MFPEAHLALITKGQFKLCRLLETGLLSQLVVLAAMGAEARQAKEDVEEGRSMQVALAVVTPVEAVVDISVEEVAPTTVVVAVVGHRCYQIWLK